MSKEYLERLVESRNRAWNEAKTILEAADAEKREMTADEKTKWENINSDLDTKDAEMRSILAREKSNTEADEARAKVEHLFAQHTPKSDTPEADLRALFRGEVRGMDFNVSPELSRHLMERRDITLGAGSAGKTAPPSTMVGRLYEELLNESNIFGASTILTTASGEPLDFPVIKAASDSIDAKVLAADASLPVSEGVALPELDPVFNKVTITPAKYGVVLQVSSELAQDTVVDLEGYIAKASARGIINNASKDMVATAVAGATTASVAWANFAAISTTGTGYTNLVDLAYSVNPQYRSNASWLVNDAFVKNVRKLMDSQNRPVWEPSVIAGQPDTILGFQVVSDPNMPTSGAAAKVAVFGDLTAHTIRQVGTIRYDVSGDFAFNADLLTYRCIWRGGSAVLDTQALKFGTITA